MMEKVFGAGDVSSPAMRRAVREWIGLYYGDQARDGYDPCQQIPYTIVRKLTGAVFAEFGASAEGFAGELLAALEPVRREAVSQALIAGECYLKPVETAAGWEFRCIPRDHLCVLGRDHLGEPTDVALAERSVVGKFVYTLIERRRLDESGLLRVENRLYRSASQGQLGERVSLGALKGYASLPDSYVYPRVIGSVGLVRVRTPMANCVDGSREGVSVYAPAVGLIRRIGENEAQLSGEFRRGQSRLVVSRDMLRGDALTDDVFVGLDEDPSQMGITVFSPQLREQSYLNRQQAYLRSVENVVGLKRGLLSQVEAVERTATEVTSSQGEYAMTIREFQQMWQSAAEKAVTLVGRLSGRKVEKAAFVWGDGIL